MKLSASFIVVCLALISAAKASELHLGKNANCELNHIFDQIDEKLPVLKQAVVNLATFTWGLSAPYAPEACSDANIVARIAALDDHVQSLVKHKEYIFMQRDKFEQEARAILSELKETHSSITRYSQSLFIIDDTTHALAGNAIDLREKDIERGLKEVESRAGVVQNNIAQYIAMLDENRTLYARLQSGSAEWALLVEELHQLVETMHPVVTKVLTSFESMEDNSAIQSSIASWSYIQQGDNSGVHRDIKGILDLAKEKKATHEANDAKLSTISNVGLYAFSPKAKAILNHMRSSTQDKAYVRLTKLMEGENLIFRMAWDLKIRLGDATSALGGMIRELEALYAKCDRTGDEEGKDNAEAGEEEEEEAGEEEEEEHADDGQQEREENA